MLLVFNNLINFYFKMRILPILLERFIVNKLLQFLENSADRTKKINISNPRIGEYFILDAKIKLEIWNKFFHPFELSFGRIDKMNVLITSNPIGLRLHISGIRLNIKHSNINSNLNKID